MCQLCQMLGLDEEKVKERHAQELKEYELMVMAKNSICEFLDKQEDHIAMNILVNVLCHEILKRNLLPITCLNRIGHTLEVMLMGEFQKTRNSEEQKKEEPPPDYLSGIDTKDLKVF